LKWQGPESIDNPDVPFLILGSDLMRFVPSQQPDEARWCRDLFYRREKGLGYAATENHYCPGHFEIELSAGKSEFNLVAAGGGCTENL
jgi:hypothetical protein